MLKAVFRLSTLLTVVLAGLLIIVGSSAIADESEWVAAEVRRIDLEAARVTLRHEEIKSLQMSGMTMGFAVRDVSMLEGFKEGDRVVFTVIRDNGRLVITQMKAAAPPVPK
jgi:Cu/Ag efflux protein CusF